MYHEKPIPQTLPEWCFKWNPLLFDYKLTQSQVLYIIWEIKLSFWIYLLQ